MSNFNLDNFIKGYTTCILEVENDENENDLGSTFDCFENHQDIVNDCLNFYFSNKTLLEKAVDVIGYDEFRAGNDFWLTRQGHGVGYWDRNELEEDGLGDALTEAAKKAGEHYGVEVGDDGKLYY